MEPTTTTSPTVAQAETATPTTSDVKVTELFNAGQRFVRQHPQFFLWYILPFLLLTILTTDMWGTPSSLGATIVIGTFTLVALILSMIHTGALLHGVHQPTGTLSFTDSFLWGKQHFFKLFWTYVVVGVLTLFGYVLLIIPGILASIFFYFTPYVFYHQNKVGLNAARASASLVKTAGWKVVTKMLVLLGLVLMVSLLVVIVTAAVTVILPEHAYIMLAVEVVLQAVFMLLGAVAVYVAARLYQAFSITTVQ